MRLWRKAAERSWEPSHPGELFLLRIGDGSTGGGGGGGGITQLTGDVTAGPGSGSQVAKLRALGNTLFVSLTGNDANDGTIAGPFATYAHAASVAIAGGAALGNPWTVIFASGDYTENLQLQPWVGIDGMDSGRSVTFTSGAPIGLGSGYTGLGAAVGVTLMSNLNLNDDLVLDYKAAGADAASLQTYNVAAGNVTITGVGNGASYTEIDFEAGGYQGTLDFTDCYIGFSFGAEAVGTLNVTASNGGGGAQLQMKLVSTDLTAVLTALHADALPVELQGVTWSPLSSLELDGTSVAITADPESFPTTITYVGGSDTQQITGTGTVQFGKTAAQSGDIRVPAAAAGWIVARDSGNTTDLKAVWTNGADEFYYGAGSSIAYTFLAGPAGNFIGLLPNGVIDCTSLAVNSTPTTFDVFSPVFITAYVEYSVNAAPPASPTSACLYGANSTAVGTNVVQISDQNMKVVLAPSGDGARPFIDRTEKSLLAVAGAGGIARATYAPGKNHVCCKVLVTVIGVGATGSDGFSEEATCTIRIDNVGTMAFVTQIVGDTNPLVDPVKDSASDATFNGVTPSSIALSIIANNLAVTVTNNGAGANDFAVFFEVKGFST